MGLFHLGVNTSFVVYRVGNTLIDTGPPNQWTKVLRFAQERPPSLVLLTHHHEDHSGNAARLKSTFGSTVLAPELSRELLKDGFLVHPYRRFFWGKPPRVETQRLTSVVEDDSGYVWEVVPTPGHADDMVCFYEPRRGWLFSADLYVASKVRYARPEDRISLEIASLRRVLKLPIERLFCSHRGPVENGHHALSKKLAYLENLRSQVFELWNRGLPKVEIQRRLVGPEDGAGWLSGRHFCKANLITACLQSALTEHALELQPEKPSM